MDDDLGAVLARYPAAVRPIAPPVALGNAGGASGARLWRFDAIGGPRVLRTWPADGPGTADLLRVHGWLERAGGLGFVPVPDRGLDGRTIQEAGGRRWEVAPWMPGAADPGRPPRRARLRAGFAGLAAFHLALTGLSTEGPSPGLAARRAELDGLIGGGFSDLERSLDRAPLDATADLARRWLDLARRLAPDLVGPLRIASARVVRLQPCLRDARPDHLLFDADRLTGLVDFGAMGVDAVSGDLARLLSEWVGPVRLARSEALAAYAAIRPLHDSEAALLDAFARPSALLMGARWARWHFLEGRAFDDPGAVPRGLLRGLDRLSELLSPPIRSDVID